MKEAKEVGGVKYLFGGRLTYADFVVGQAIGLDRDDEPSVFKEVPITSPFDGEFPELRGYAKGILHRYVTAEDIRFPPPRFDVGRNVVE